MLKRHKSSFEQKKNHVFWMYMLRVIAKRVSKGPAGKQGLGRPRLYVLICFEFWKFMHDI